ncbi:MAG: hypothetical protein CL786_06220 [Chloroflexi bacterium]|nr:hypothetical protein [Chloroflexota bacterium]|tara:strand:+ start:455 stop:1408 length:954 start_codon:yes stop_codon:yes gene_type:complete
MRKISFVLSSLLILFAGGVRGSIPDDVHEKCKDVQDYVGCVQIFTGKVQNTNSYEFKLKEALRLLPGRIDNTSLASFSSSIQPFTDALSLALTDESIKDSQLVIDSQVISKGLGHIRYVWDMSIEKEVKRMSMKNCVDLNQLLQRINRSMGGLFVTYVEEKGGRWCSYYGRKEIEMISKIKELAINVANGKNLEMQPFCHIVEYFQYPIGCSISKNGAITEEPIAPIKLVPVYPRKAQKNGIEGCVILEFIVTERGEVKDPVVVRSQPNGIFEKSAIKAIKKAKYDSFPSSRKTSFTINFVIQGPNKGPNYRPPGCE